MGLIMSIYAQFYKPAIPTKWNNHSTRLIEGCGDRAIIQVDARLSLTSQLEVAKRVCGERSFNGFKLVKGDNLLDCKAITKLIEVA